MSHTYALCLLHNKDKTELSLTPSKTLSEVTALKLEEIYGKVQKSTKKAFFCGVGAN